MYLLDFLMISRYRRLALLWLAALALFWGAAAVLAWQGQHNPPTMAAFRYKFTENPTFNWGSDKTVSTFLWRYIGPRPGEGEVLRVAFRQGTHQPEQNKTMLVAYTGDEQLPDKRGRIYRSTSDIPDNFFEMQFVDIKSWPAGKELWLGTEATASTMLWNEPGPLGGGVLESPAAYRKGGGGFRRDKLEHFSSVSPRVVPEDALLPDYSLPFKTMGWLAFALLALGLAARGTLRWYLAGAALQLVLFFKVAEVLYPSQWLWGGYYQPRLGLEWFWTGLVLIQLLTFPPVFVAAKGAANAFWIWLARWRRWPVGLAALAATTAVYYLASSTLEVRGVYGDGYGSLEWPGWDYHNPMATALYHAWRDGLYHFRLAIGQPMQLGLTNFQLIYTFNSFFAPIYVIGCGMIAWQLGRSPRERTGILLALLLLKACTTHLGYLEVYGPSLGVQSVLAALIIWGIRRSTVVLPTIFSFFGYLFQMGGAMALPAVAVLWLVSFWKAGGKALWLPTRLAACGISALLLWALTLGMLFTFKHDQNVLGYMMHVPPKAVQWEGETVQVHGLAMLFGSSGRPGWEVFMQKKNIHPVHFYLFFTWKHASQLLVEFLFLSGPVFLWLFLGMAFTRRWAFFNPERWAFGLAALAFLAASLYLATSFPYPKDWDVFSLPSFWWMAAFFVFMTRGGMIQKAGARWLLFALVLYLIWDTGGWWIYNLTWGPAAPDRRFVFY